MSIAKPLLEGQRVLIIGGGSRMGLATAQRTVDAGARVVLASRSASRLEEAAANITGDVTTHVADVSSPEAAAAMFKALAPLDHIVVTASSGDAPASSIPNTTPEIAQSAFLRFWISYLDFLSCPALRPPVYETIRLDNVAVGQQWKTARCRLWRVERIAWQHRSAGPRCSHRTRANPHQRCFTGRYWNAFRPATCPPCGTARRRGGNDPCSSNQPGSHEHDN